MHVFLFKRCLNCFALNVTVELMFQIMACCQSWNLQYAYIDRNSSYLNLLSSNANMLSRTMQSELINFTCVWYNPQYSYWIGQIKTMAMESFTSFYPMIVEYKLGRVLHPWDGPWQSAFGRVWPSVAEAHSSRVAAFHPGAPQEVAARTLRTLCRRRKGCWDRKMALDCKYGVLTLVRFAG